MAQFPSATKVYHTEVYSSISPTRPELSAQGKTVVITGGGTGIGAATAHNFAQAGASRIALLGRRSQPLLDTKKSIEQKFPGTNVLAAPVDVTNKSQVHKVLQDFAEGGRIDVLISNAATVGPQDPAAQVDADKFVDAVKVNIGGTLNVLQGFVAHAAKDAVIIEVNSSAAHVNFGPGFTAYSVSKMGVFRLWDSFAFANPDMSVFHVQPGVVASDMSKEVGATEAVGNLDDVSLPAGFHLWLASPEARFLKGRYLWANWDVDELKSRAHEIEAGQKLTIGLVGWPFKDSSWNFKSADGSWD